jgi:hypothetical protein
VNEARGGLDPSLAYDVSEFGHLGYDPELGPPNAELAVQAQYRGSWDLWLPPNDNPAVADFLADKVIEFIRQPLPQQIPGPVYLGRQDSVSVQATMR